MMTSRETVIRAIKFQNPERLPYSLPEKYGSDIYDFGFPHPDRRPKKGVDEWGAVWDNIGGSNLGQVKDYPLKDWSNFDKLRIPDINDPKRWETLKGTREKAGDKFLLGWGISIYERVHFIRGFENTWADIYEEPENLCRLLDILTDMSIEIVNRYGKEGFDGYIFCDDWGLQNQLMISPAKWRELWKPRYARIFDACHKNGILTFLHSCGYIVEILDDLIEIGLDVIHMDQQENMGLELLGERFGGRITFYAPVDIQKTMVYGTLDDIRAYCRKMTRLLGRPEGGFIARWYTDPVGAGHRQEALDAMCEEFLKISNEMSGK